jgi:signal peptidase I
MRNNRSTLRANRWFLAIMLAFGLVRTAVADYNPVPSGSMHPNILEGDVILVNRLAYNVKLPLTNIVLSHTGNPARGDIATFFSPQDGARLVKRVIGLPGDVIEMRNKELVVNGRRIKYVSSGVSMANSVENSGHGYALPARRLREVIGDHPYQIQWLSGIESAPNFGPLAIPVDQYLMLGDNRDNSADSRFIGLVPRHLLIGRAERILVSAAITDNWMPRFDRFGQSLYE